MEPPEDPRPIQSGRRVLREGNIPLRIRRILSTDDKGMTSEARNEERLKESMRRQRRLAEMKRRQEVGLPTEDFPTPPSSDSEEGSGFNKKIAELKRVSKLSGLRTGGRLRTLF